MNTNAPWLDDSTNTYRLMEKALDAFNECEVSPSLILLKTYYSLLHQEGYPVRQDWRVNIPATDQDTLSTLLHKPLKDLQDIPDSSAKYFWDKLLHWAKHHTSFHF